MVHTRPLAGVILTLSCALVVHATTYDDVIDKGQTILAEFYDRYNATKEVDLVFVIDRSGSVPKEGWVSMLRFIERILEHFTVDQDNTRVAIVTYSTTARVDINDLDLIDETFSENKCTLFSRIRDKVEPYAPSGYTATYDALNKTFNVLLTSRPNAKKAVLVLTDGKSNIGPPPVKIAVDILSLRWGTDWDSDVLGPQTEIYAFGIENAYFPELRSVASHLENHAFLIPKFSLFEDFARSLHGGLQDDNWVETKHHECGPTCNSTFALCMCGSKIGVSKCVCQPGYEMVNGFCKECPVGFYKMTFRPESCHACLENMTTDAIGSSSIDDCQYLPGHRRCPSLPDVTHGVKFQVTGTRRDEVLHTGVTCDDVTDGNSCHYECDEGFRLTGSPVMVCNHSGAWEGRVPSCEAIDCHRLEAVMGSPEGGTLAYSQNHTLYGATVTATCHPDRVPLPAVTSWSCDSHGRWTRPNNFKCERVYCNPFEVQEFMTVDPPDCSVQARVHGSVCSLGCAEGFMLRGNGTKVCSYTKQSLWLPWAKVICQDVQDPHIECPDDVTVTVADFPDTSTKVHFDWKPVALTDNSGRVTYDVADLPVDGVFYVGNTVLTYRAVDESGNTDTCTQNVHVIEKEINITFCPQSIVREGRAQAVSWSDPVFTGPDSEQMVVQCVPESGSIFSQPKTHVVCYTNQNPAVNCEFDVEVKVKECPEPKAIAPVRGSLVCGYNEYAQNICRVLCESGYGPKALADLEFRCREDGLWNPPFDEIPKCFPAFFGRRTTIKDTIHIRYEGNCENNTERIQTAFEETMEAILTDEFGPCVSPHTCTVQDVVVICGSQKRKSKIKRSTSPDEVEFTLSVSREPDSFNETHPDMTKDDNTVMIETFKAVITNFSLDVLDGTFVFDVNGSKVFGEETYPLSDLPDTPECMRGQISMTVGDDLETLSNMGCVTCAAGTYLSGNDCRPCPVNNYQSAEGQDHCDACPANTSTIYNGAWSISHCKAACGVGFESTTGYEPCYPVCTEGYHSATGYEPCEPCEIGYFQHLPEQVECNKCPDNTTTAKKGTTSVYDCGVLCAENTFSKNGIEPCVECPPGTYQPQRGQTTQCLRCDAAQNNVSQWCPDPVNCTNYNVLCHHGYCVVSHTNTTQCACSPGYHGDACELDIDECLEGQCFNGGTCLDEVNGYSCNCTAPFAGRQCEKYVGPCSTKPCQHNSSCVDRDLTYECFCQPGYNGTNCEDEVDTCTPNPCVHGDCSPQGRLYDCTCQEGYAGSNCQKAIDYCSNVTCLYGGTCSANGTDVGCTCPHGHTGASCEKLVDFCTPDPCDGRGRCINIVGDYFCACDADHFGRNCEKGGSPMFDLRFSGDSYAAVPMWDELEELSVCLWLRTEDKLNAGTLFSYAAHSNWLSTTYADVLTVYDPAMLKVIINGDLYPTTIALNDGHWQHVCITWSQRIGLYVYVNGTLMASATVAADTYIERGGMFIMGQRQVRQYQQYFVPSHGYRGEISKLDVYSYQLDVDRVEELANATQCIPGDGNVISWTSVLDGGVHGAEIVEESLCLDDNECRWQSVCGPDEMCVDSSDGFDCVPCGRDCPNIMKPDDYCTSSPCQNSGSCVSEELGFRCVCPRGFSGETCEYLQRNCSVMTCNDHGICHETENGALCKCHWPWYGRFCEVFYEPTCVEKPCLNSGQCERTNSSYECVCPEDGRAYGDNCEILTPCDTVPPPCIEGATCVVLETDDIMCLCPRDYQGRDCRRVETTTIPTTTSDPCLSINCHNGGTCENHRGGFKCRCVDDYAGEYCNTLKHKEVRKYDVTVSLKKKYSPGLKENKVFKEEFRQEIHKVYSASKIGAGKLWVEINDVRQGSVEVDFTLHHTVYTDETVPGPGKMKEILYSQLQNNKLGSYDASLNNFKFNYIAPSNALNWAINLIIALAVVTVIVVIVIGVYVYLRRRRSRGPRKLNNMPLVELNRVENPAFEPDSGPATPQMRHLQDDNIYSDLGEPSPYAIDVCSGDKPNEPDLVKNFPSKKGRDINREWAHIHRQSIPLPPKPGDAAASNGREDGGYLLPCSGIPPPAYRDVHDKKASEKYGRNNLNPDAIRPMTAHEEKYGAHDDVYLEPKDNRTKAQAANLHVYINNTDDVKQNDDQTATYLPLLSSPQEEISEEAATKEQPRESVREESPEYLLLKEPDTAGKTDAGEESGDQPPKPIIRDLKQKEKTTEPDQKNAPASPPVVVPPPIPTQDSPPDVVPPPIPLTSSDEPPPLPTCPPPDDDLDTAEDTLERSVPAQERRRSSTAVYAINNTGS